MTRRQGGFSSALYRSQCYRASLVVTTRRVPYEESNAEKRPWPSETKERADMLPGRTIWYGKTCKAKPFLLPSSLKVNLVNQGAYEYLMYRRRVNGKDYFMMKNAILGSRVQTRGLLLVCWRGGSELGGQQVDRPITWPTTATTRPPNSPNQTVSIVATVLTPAGFKRAKSEKLLE